MADEAVEAARVGDQVKHSNAMIGVLVGVLVGAAFAVAVVGTGGAALVIGAAICTGMSIGGSVGQLVGKHIPGSDCGPIAKGVPTVYVENMEAAVVTSPVSCNGPPIGNPHPTSQIAQGSSNVFIGKFPAARKGDKTTCGAKIGYGAATVWIGGKKTTYLEISPEVPAWVDYGLMALGILGGWGALARAGFSTLGIVCRLGGGLIGGGVGSYGGSKLADFLGLDEDSWARDGLVVGGGVTGGALGYKAGMKVGEGTIVPNKLAAHERIQATEIAKKYGGTFEGQKIRDMPGIDGVYQGKPTSLKQYTGESPSGVLKHASKSETQLSNANYSDATIYVDAKNVSGKTLIDFAKNGPLSEIPKQGIVSKIMVNTKDGWVIIDKSGVVKNIFP
ncbi:MAG: PAAR domain-containing protein [Chitinophagaceae bacterium]